MKSYLQGCGRRCGGAAARGLLAAGMMLCAIASSIAETPPTLLGSAERLAGVTSWAYQLHGVDPAAITASPYDLVVIDYSRNGGDARRFTPAEVKLMQAKQDGSRRLVLAYMSIGEAEDYRFYWERGWVETAPPRHPDNDGKKKTESDGRDVVRVPKLSAPSWLGRENEQWPGNYYVRYWSPDWHDVMIHNPDSYLSRIISAGFDGVYLDRVDAYYRVERDKENAKEWMVNFVTELATVARQAKPGFIVVPQNAEELLGESRYLAAIDGAAKEDLLYGNDGDGDRNSKKQIARSLRQLEAASAVQLRVLAVEYLNDPKLIERANTELRSHGMIPYFGPRGLDRLETQMASPAADEPASVISETAEP